jgi:hypothetical protein
MPNSGRSLLSGQWQFRLPRLVANIKQINITECVMYAVLSTLQEIN